MYNTRQLLVKRNSAESYRLLEEGFTQNDDRLPERFHTAPLEGPLKGVKIDPAAHTETEAVETYYQLLGWDQDGVPTKACLTALDLQWAATFL